MVTVTFLIPVRHPDNSRDWSRLKTNLAQTVQSIAAQTHADWRGIVVANEGSDLPTLPERFTVEWVRFPPNLQHEQGGAPREDFLDAFRMDKGRRVLKGMLRARDSRYFMIVDDDDFVSARITQHAVDHPDAYGWTVDMGYVWNDGGKVLYRHPALNHVCGSSLIIRSDLYRLPSSFEEASAEYIKDILGSHRRIAALLAERGTPLASLPFPGAIYRVGHSSSHSQTPPILRKYVLNRNTLRRPRQIVANLARLRFVDSAAKREFFGYAKA
ncbi:MAG: galactosyl transferase [Steroidobacteraceae bacterium]